MDFDRLRQARVDGSLGLIEEALVLHRQMAAAGEPVTKESEVFFAAAMHAIAELRRLK